MLMVCNGETNFGVECTRSVCDDAFVRSGSAVDRSGGNGKNESVRCGGGADVWCSVLMCLER